MPAKADKNIVLETSFVSIIAFSEKILTTPKGLIQYQLSTATSGIVMTFLGYPLKLM